MLLKTNRPTVIIGAGMAGLSAAMTLAAQGEPVTLLEARCHPGGKMRQLFPATKQDGLHDEKNTLGAEHNEPGIDSGPTVFTMKWVFDRLFALCGTSPEQELQLTKAVTLARHAWDQNGAFDLFADEKASRDSVAAYFGPKEAAGFARFCQDSAAIYETLRDTFIAAQRPSPLGLAHRVGWTNVSDLLALKPMSSLWRALGAYFSDPRLQQLYGRYATYVGSSPYQAPATLMLIAHVEQDGVWTLDGGMHALARAMKKLAEASGATVKMDALVQSVEVDQGRASAVILKNGERIEAGRVLWCGDVSALPDALVSPSKDTQSSKISQTVRAVPEKHRSLSAITWSAEATADGFCLDHHNVFFSPNYRDEFASIFKRGEPPKDPTVYLCAQDRLSDGSGNKIDSETERERILCLTNAPAFGDRRTLSDKELAQCQNAMTNRLAACGLHLSLEPHLTTITQPAIFNRLFPASGGALYGRASHGWMASFARPGSKTKIPGLYLAGGSVHPGPGVPMATLSGLLAAQQILADRVLT